MKRIICQVFIIHLLLCIAVAASGQGVALVLSGGGAKGAAHIGVLKALEEHGIPIDYISGTSMGSIVGGLYASGYTPREIEGFITTDAFQRWAKGEIDPRYRFYFKQAEPDASWVEVLFDYDTREDRFKTRLPTNFISPYQLDFAFLDMFSGSAAAAQYDFDSLFVPFRCVASEIETNQAVILDKGLLSKAIRASMTYPFYFKPIKVNGKLMFDGGMYNNFPVDVAIENFQPDVIIGSKSVSNYEVPDEDDLLSQIRNMIVTKTDYTMPPNSVLIEPNLEMVNVIDFSKTEAMIDSGYNAAVSKVPEIEKLVSRKISPGELKLKRDRFNLRKPSLIIDTIIIQGLTRGQSMYVSRLLKKKSQYLTIDKLHEKYYRVIYDPKIKFAYPSLKYNPGTGYYSLILDVKKAERFAVKVGGNISSSAASAAFLGLEYRLLGRTSASFRGNGYVGRFYSSAQLDTRIDFSTILPFYMALRLTYNHRDYFKNQTYFFEDKDPSYLIENESYFGISFGIPATNNGRLYAEYDMGYNKDEYYQTNNFSRYDTTDRTYFEFWTSKVCFDINTLNYKQYANQGKRLSLVLQYVDGREKTVPGSTSANDAPEIIEYHRWLQLRLRYDNYFKQFGPLTFGFYGELFFSNQPFFSNYTATLLNTAAFNPLPEMKTLFLPNYRAPVYGAVGLKAIFNIYRQLDLRVEGYFFQPYEELAQAADGSAEYKTPLSYNSVIGSATVLYHTPVGPVSVSFNYYDRADNNFSVLFNIGYIIFNKSAYNN